VDDFCNHIFYIIGTNPQDIPLGRLAAYMSELASFMGSEEHLRFARLETGSVGIVVNSPKKYEGVIVSRTLEAASGQPDALAARSWRKINEYLKKDNCTGKMLLSDGSKVRFPGEIEPSYAPLRSIVQRTSIQGRLVRIEGGGDVIKVGLETDGNLKASQISLNPVLATELAGHFHKNIRLDGVGKWGRDGDGNWYLENLQVTSFEELQDLSLKETLEKLKTIIPQEGSRFLVDSIDEMRQI